MHNTRTTNLYRLTIAALLTAVGIIIPTFSPFKILLEPASYTLASHVAIFIAMFVSPTVAVTVTIGTTVGFLFGGFPIVVVLRAASHIVFVVIGSLWLKARPNMLQKPGMLLAYSFVIGVIHAAAEVVVVSIFYFSGAMTGYYAMGFVQAVLGLVGAGSVVHSMVDFAIAVAILYPITTQSGTKFLFPYALPRRKAQKEGML